MIRVLEDNFNGVVNTLLKDHAPDFKIGSFNNRWHSGQNINSENCKFVLDGNGGVVSNSHSANKISETFNVGGVFDTANLTVKIKTLNKWSDKVCEFSLIGPSDISPQVAYTILITKVGNANSEVLNVEMFQEQNNVYATTTITLNKNLEHTLVFHVEPTLQTLSLNGNIILSGNAEANTNNPNVLDKNLASCVLSLYPSNTSFTYLSLDVDNVKTGIVTKFKANLSPVRAGIPITIDWEADYVVSAVITGIPNSQYTWNEFDYSQSVIENRLSIPGLTETTSYTLTVTDILGRQTISNIIVAVTNSTVEKITQAAIRITELAKNEKDHEVMCGSFENGHNGIRNNITELKDSKKNKTNGNSFYTAINFFCTEEGFMTTDRGFISRKEAIQIAIDANQIKSTLDLDYIFILLDSHIEPEVSDDYIDNGFTSFI